MAAIGTSSRTAPSGALNRAGFATALFSIPAVLLALELALNRAPQAALAAGGDVQRIFYFHVPFAMAAFVGFFGVMAASIGFLARGTRIWDQAAEAAAEVGLLCCTAVLLTGPVWARYAWGAWWTWDARLTSTLVLWLIYASYLLLRMFAAGDPRVRRHSAVLGIVGSIGVPMVYMSVHWFRTQHPEPFIFRSGGLAPGMGSALAAGAVAVFLIAVTLFLLRMGTASLEAATGDLRAAIEEEDRP